MVGLAPGDGEFLLPVAVEALAVIGLDDEATPAIRPAVGFIRERGPDLVAGGGGRPAVGGRLGPARRDGVPAPGPAAASDPGGQDHPGQGDGPARPRDLAPSADVHVHDPSPRWHRPAGRIRSRQHTRQADPPGRGVGSRRIIRPHVRRGFPARDSRCGSDWTQDRGWQDGREPVRLVDPARLARVRRERSVHPGR